MAPPTRGAAAFHINLIVITALASTLSTGSIAVFYFANNLQSVPISLIGVSLAIASFAPLSRLSAEKDREGFRESLSFGLQQIMFLIIPVSLLMFLLRAHIVRFLLGTGEFGWDATRLTAAALGVFAFGIVFYAAIPLLTRSFFSRQDTKTPTVISLVSIGFNIAFAFLFIWLLSFENILKNTVSYLLDLDGIGDFRIIALPLALILAGGIQFLLLVWKGKRYVGRRELLSSLKRISIGSIVLVAVVFGVLQVTAQIWDLDTFIEVLSQLIGASALGILSYGIVMFLLKSPELNFFIQRFKRG